MSKRAQPDKKRAVKSTFTGVRVFTWILFLTGISSIFIGFWFYQKTIEELLDEESHLTAMLQIEALASSISSRVSNDFNAAVKLADNEVVRQSVKSANPDIANTLCDTLADSLHPAVVYIMNLEGVVTATSNRNTPTSFLAKNYSFRPYFKAAAAGTPYVYLAVGATSGERGVYYSAPVKDQSGKTISALVIKSQMDFLDQNFMDLAQFGEILLIEKSGFILASTKPGWLYSTLWKKSKEELKAMKESRQFGSGPWDWTGLTRAGDEATGITGANYVLHEAGIKALEDFTIVYLHDMGITEELMVEPLLSNVARTILPGVMVLVVLSAALFVLIQRAIGREKELNNELVDALNEVDTLRGILPICSFCKKIRSDEGAWDAVESYISKHSEARFSHGVCPNCLDEHYGDLEDETGHKD